MKVRDQLKVLATVQVALTLITLAFWFSKLINNKMESQKVMTCYAFLSFSLLAEV